MKLEDANQRSEAELEPDWKSLRFVCIFTFAFWAIRFFGRGAASEENEVPDNKEPQCRPR